MRSFWVAFAIFGLMAGAAAQQVSPQPVAPVAQSTVAAPSAAAKKKRVVRRIPIETAPPSQVTPPTPAQDAQQRAQDDKIRAADQARSAADAKVTDKIVQQAQERQDKVQNEIRIQDAPGPAQTGIVPAAGPPTVPATTTAPVTPPPPPGEKL